MSVSSSAPSTNTSPSSWGLNDRLVSLMESIYAIIAGLGLRYVVDTVSRHDFKITGTLVGLWEGVILLHFLKKLPKSTDPYLAFAVRLFIDFVITESVSRLVLVLTWTGMGMILADVAPAIWEDVGLRRVWRRFRRDLYIISESVPTVVFFPPTRTVRFSPSREPSVIAEAEEEEPNADAHTEARSVESSTSAGLTEQDTSANVETSVRRRLPGYFPGMLSDTESVASSVLSRDIRLPSTLQRDSERTSRRLSVYPITTPDHDSASETSSQRNEEDDIKLSSSASSQSTVTGPADTTRFTDDLRITEDFDTTQLTDIPDEILEEQKPAETTEKETIKKDQHPEVNTALKPPNPTLFLPPTPSDSQPPLRRRLPKDDQLRPSSASIPQIPDLPEEFPSDGPSEGWENIQKEDANDPEFPWEQVQREDAVGADIPPPPPPKDWVNMNHLERFLATNTNDRAGLGETSTTNDEHRYSQPPPYFDHVDDHDDIYEDHPSVSGGVAVVFPNPGLADSTLGDRRHGDETRINKWLEQEVVEKKREEEAEQQRQREVAEKRRLKEEAAAQERKEEEAAAQRREDEEAEKRKLEEKAVEQKRREEEKKRQKDAAEQRRKEEEARRRLEAEEAEKKRKEEEAAETKRLEELEKKHVEEEKKRVEEEEKRVEEEEKRVQREEKERVQREEKEHVQREEKERVQREEKERVQREEKERIEKEEKERIEKEEKERIEREEQERIEREEKERIEKEEMEKRRKEKAVGEAKRLEELEEERIEKEAAEQRRREKEAAEKPEEQEAEVERRRQEEAAEKLRKNEETKEDEKWKEDEAEKHKEDEAAEMNRLDEATTEMRRQDGEQEGAENQKLEEARLKEGENSQAVPQSSQPVETIPTPSASALAKTPGGDAQQSAEIVDGEAQANEEAGNNEPDAGEQHRMETESVATDQSTIPSNVESRLNRILLTKAQIVEIQSRIDELGTQLDGADSERTSHELQRAHRILEKLKRKDQRRRDEAIPLQLGPGLNDRDDHISLDAYGQDGAKMRLLEKLEELLSPEATSLFLTVDCGPKRVQRQQKQAVTEVLTKFILLDQSTAKGRQTIINVPPENFSIWLTAYRASITQADDTDM